MKKVTLFLSFITFTTTSVLADDLSIAVTNTTPGSSVGAIDLTVSGGTAPYTYSWSGPGGIISTSEDINNLSIGSYTVTVTDKYCGIATLTVKISDSSTDISKVDADHITLSPNPANNQLTICSTEQLQKAFIRLMSISGKVIQKEDNFNGTNFIVDVSALCAGIYFIEVINNNSVSRIKFVKN
jgi:hypothetical protein